MHLFVSWKESYVDLTRFGNFQKEFVNRPNEDELIDLIKRTRSLIPNVQSRITLIGLCPVNRDFKKDAEFITVMKNTSTNA